MKSIPLKKSQPLLQRAFTLVELLVVIVIMSILMTAGAIGLSGMGGKGVSSGVATAESLFDEARSTAIGKGLKTCVLVARSLTNNPNEDLRRIVIGIEPVRNDGTPSTNAGSMPTWVVSSRGALLPDQTFFSSTFSKKDVSSSGDVPTVTLTGVKPAYAGEYYIYEFNSQGNAINSTDNTYEGGASFVVGSGTRSNSKPAKDSPPKVTSAGKRDFGGFVVWRNGSTSAFRNPSQIDGGRAMKLESGKEF